MSLEMKEYTVYRLYRKYMVIYNYLMLLPILDITMTNIGYMF